MVVDAAGLKGDGVETGKGDEGEEDEEVVVGVVGSRIDSFVDVVKDDAVDMALLLLLTMSEQLLLLFPTRRREEGDEVVVDVPLESISLPRLRG